MTTLKTVQVFCSGNCMSEFMGLITGSYEAKVCVLKAVDFICHNRLF